MKGRIYMNGQQEDNREEFTSIDDIIDFYTQAQAEQLQHSNIQKSETKKPASELR
jgi:hypothetical protein